MTNEFTKNLEEFMVNVINAACVNKPKPCECKRNVVNNLGKTLASKSIKTRFPFAQSFHATDLYKKMNC